MSNGTHNTINQHPAHKYKPETPFTWCTDQSNILPKGANPHQSLPDALLKQRPANVRVHRTQGVVQKVHVSVVVHSPCDGHTLLLWV